MDENRSDVSTQQIPVGDLTMEPEADELLESVTMKPYMDLAMAIMGGKDSAPAVEALASLPLEARYVWRVASALKWAFADLETLNVEVDRQTLSPEDLKRLVELLKHRPLQFCLFLSALFGQAQMERMMLSAIKKSRSIAGSQGQDQ